MRRGTGIAALERQTQYSAHYTTLSKEINESTVDELRKEISSFRRSLRSFALAHRKDLRQNPEFRHAFQQMCTSMLVDPLAGHPSTTAAGSRLGKVGELWNDLLGFSDWQHELGVQIVDVCVSTRQKNGGIISMNDLLAGIVRLRRSSECDHDSMDAHITEKDIQRSIQALEPLGCGYEVFSLNNQLMVRTLPMELSGDTIAILQHLSSDAAQTDHNGLCFVTAHDAEFSASSYLRGWTSIRAQRALDDMSISEGLLWLDIVPDDIPCESEDARRRYYSFSLVQPDSGVTQPESPSLRS
ncbi:ESCRT II complex subunit Dot2 [Malassezia yamatoensis]|uniref:ESCRT II complex subunit Dot2 n=1 Tax=Malassezia yamatoensis TaxID=253288 RepID=A0AAJ6CGP5_9BASI|nr:ESCRT II complex subunit Dot2 [Malassezia yamatoensis]